MLDSAFTRKPNISILTAEALVLYTKNKTAKWLESKSQDEKDQLFNDLKSQSKRIRSEWKQRREEVRQVRLKKLQEKQDKIVLTERRKIQRKEKRTTEIVNDGLLQSRDTVENVLSDCVSESARVQLLKKQLTFRRDVLGQKAPTGKKNVFRFSCKIGPGPKDVHKLNSAELKDNLFSLFYDVSGHYVDANPPPGCPQLVGRRIAHTFDVDGDEQTWNGHVTGTVTGFPFLFNVVYDEIDEGEPEDAVYQYRLWEDWTAGFLKVL